MRRSTGWDLGLHFQFVLWLLKVKSLSVQDVVSVFGIAACTARNWCAAAEKIGLLQRRPRYRGPLIWVVHPDKGLPPRLAATRR
jgi:hypothetical protein